MSVIMTTTQLLYTQLQTRWQLPLQNCDQFEFQYCGKYTNNGFGTQNPTKQDGLIQAIGIDNERMNSKLKRVTNTALSMIPK